MNLPGWCLGEEGAVQNVTAALCIHKRGRAFGLQGAEKKEQNKIQNLKQLKEDLFPFCPVLSWAA